MPIQKARKGLQMSLPSRHRFLFGMLPHPRVKKEKKRNPSSAPPETNAAPALLSVPGALGPAPPFPRAAPASLLCLSAFAPEWDHSQKGRKSQADEGRGGDGLRAARRLCWKWHTDSVRAQPGRQDTTHPNWLLFRDLTVQLPTS